MQKSLRSRCSFSLSLWHAHSHRNAHSFCDGIVRRNFCWKGSLPLNSLVLRCFSFLSCSFFRSFFIHRHRFDVDIASSKFRELFSVFFFLYFYLHSDQWQQQLPASRLDFHFFISVVRALAQTIIHRRSSRTEPKKPKGKRPFFFNVAVHDNFRKANDETEWK